MDNRPKPASDDSSLTAATTTSDTEKGREREREREPLSEVHTRHLYDGYPEHYLDASSTRASTTGRSKEVGASALSRLQSRATGIRPVFTHHAASKKTTEDVIVDFDGPDDPYRSIKWSFKKKFYTTALYGLFTMGATWGSSIYSSATDKISAEFGVAPVVSTLGITLYLFGFGTGPMIWAPLSEIFGRKTAVFYPYAISICFVFGSATAKDFQTLMLTRFFTGFFSSAPVTNTGGVLGDLWTAGQRGPAMAGYAMAVAGGPLVGPIVGGAIVDSYLSWRWTEYVSHHRTIIHRFLLNCLNRSLAFSPPSSSSSASSSSTSPTPQNSSSTKRAAFATKLATGPLHAKHEEWDVSLSGMAHKYLVRPFQILFTPIAACMATYASFVYGILYLCFAAFPIEFEETRGWNHLVGSLPFLATLLGCMTGAFTNALNTKYYMGRVTKNNGRPVPEARLPPMMLGSVIFPAGMFIFGWTSKKSIFWFW